jgi:preprotein translocase subunit Sss1
MPEYIQKTYSRTLANGKTKKYKQYYRVVKVPRTPTADDPSTSKPKQERISLALAEAVGLDNFMKVGKKTAGKAKKPAAKAKKPKKESSSSGLSDADLKKIKRQVKSELKKDMKKAEKKAEKKAGAFGVPARTSVVDLGF